MGPSPIPVSNPTASFWASQPHPLDDHQGPAELPDEVDIAIIGAGFSGAATVHHILDICRIEGIKQPSIAIFEARGACSGATGRNGGHMRPDPYNKPASILLSDGAAAASEFADFEVENLNAVKDLVEKEKIDCDFVLTRTMDVFMSQEMEDSELAKVELLRKNNVSAVRDVYVYRGPEAEQFTGVKGATACLTYSAGHLSPRKLVLHLLSNAIDAGVSLYTHTPVLSVSKSQDLDGSSELETSRGSVRARKVVYATNGYTSSVLPEFADKIIPVRGICSHLVVPNEKQPAPLLQNTYLLWWSPSEYDYLIPRLDGSIVIGKSKSKEFSDMRSWYDNTSDDSLIDDANSFFEGYMQKHFQGWEDSKAYTGEVWSGIMGYPIDSMPHVGAVPGRDNHFIVAGFTGNGMPIVYLAARGLASMVLGLEDLEGSGIPRGFKTSQERLDDRRNLILEGWAAT